MKLGTITLDVPFFQAAGWQPPSIRGGWLNLGATFLYFRLVRRRRRGVLVFVITPVGWGLTPRIFLCPERAKERNLQTV